MEKISSEQSKIEQFLAAPQFQRMFEVVATYQRLLEENKSDQEKYDLIKKRFHDEFDPPPLEESERPALYNESLALRKQVLLLSEAGHLTKEKLATLLARSVLADGMLEQYHAKPGGDATENGGKLINEVVAYNSKKDEDWVNLNIIPTSVRGTGELLVKIKEGFQAVAQELKNGPLQHVKQVEMHSWLLGPDFADKVAVIFGEDAKITDLSDDPDLSTTKQIQDVALSYNKRAVERYLLTGKLPEVRELKMTSEDFIKRFGIVGE